MKRNIYLIVFFFFMGIVSCEDEIFDKEPLDTISDNVLWQDQTLTERYLLGVFLEMDFLYSETGMEWDPNAFWWYQPWSQHDLITVSDEGRHCFPWYPTFTRWGRGAIDQNGGFLENWLYPIIRKANILIQRMDETNLDPEFANYMVLNARWIRAMCYFQMVKKYGGVPIITKAQSIDDPKEELFVSRAKEVEVYDFIITEMDEIAPLLPDRVSNGLPGKYAAYALKSRAALYAASIATWGEVKIDGLVGIPASEANRFWQICYDASNKIITEGEYSLYNKYPEDKVKNYRQLFTDDVNNPESIFAIVFDGKPGVGRTHGWDLFTGPQGLVAWAGSAATVYLEMVESFENIDGTPGTFDRAKFEEGLWTHEDLFGNKEPRFHAIIATQSTPWQGKQVEYYTHLIKPNGEVISGLQNGYEGVMATGNGNIEGGGVTGFSVLKYVDENLIMPDADHSTTDWMVFRLGEIILNMAEASLELGKTGEALDLVNQIRDRAGVTLLTSIDREKLRHERKIELAFENGHRWYDLRRWRTAVDAISKEFKGLNYRLDYNSYAAGTPKYKITVIENVDGEYRKNFFERMYYLPITTGRIANNPNLAPENPGY